MILDIWGNDHDVTNFCVTDKALVVNSSGRNTTMGGTFTLNDELRINRPAGRLDYQLLYVQYGESHHMLDGKWRGDLPSGRAPILFLSSQYSRNLSLGSFFRIQRRKPVKAM